MPRARARDGAIGCRLVRLREKAGLTQAQLAQMAGVPPGTLKNWETGHREPMASALPALAAALQVTTDDLLGFRLEDNPPIDPPPRSKRGRPRKTP